MRENKTKKRFFAAFSTLAIAFAMVLSFGTVTAKADYYYLTNDTTGYEAFVADEAELLTDEEETELINELYMYTNYGNMFAYTTYVNGSDYEGNADLVYRDIYDGASGIIFQIDMNNRKITIRAYGDLRDAITNAYCDTITDNVYSYASDEDYSLCISATFEQIGTLLEGGHIAQPMKYISNAILALIIGILINYLILRATSSTKAASDRKIMNGMKNVRLALFNPNARFTHETRVYNPHTSSSSGGGGGGGGGSSSGSHGF